MHHPSCHQSHNHHERSTGMGKTELQLQGAINLDELGLLHLNVPFHRYRVEASKIFMMMKNTQRKCLNAYDLFSPSCTVGQQMSSYKKLSVRTLSINIKCNAVSRNEAPTYQINAYHTNINTTLLA